MKSEDSKSMVIFVVLIRLFCVFWFLELLLVHSVQFYMTISMYEDESSNVSSAVPSLLLGMFFVVLILLFVFSLPIARVLFSGLNIPVKSEKISEAVLYTAVFVGVGAYFFLSNIGTSLQHVYHYAVRVMDSKQVGDAGGVEATMRYIYGDNQPPSLLENPLFIQSAIGSLFGLVLILSAKVWAGKLTRQKFPNAE